uniref:Uncharacterized protein n=1 Tax=Helianthus annuus TaxID=4232 RepID=A0A251VKA1_HELAN
MYIVNLWIPNNFGVQVVISKTLSLSHSIFKTYHREPSILITTFTKPCGVDQKGRKRLRASGSSNPGCRGVR